MSAVVINLLHASSIVFALVFAPLMFMASVLYRKQFKQVDFEWKKPEISVFTIVAFVLNLTFFIAACFFFAEYLGRTKLGLFDLSDMQLRTLCTDSLMLFGGVTLFYLAVQNFYVQPICRQGIAFPQWNWKKLNLNIDLLRWEDINDYYMRSDYPITHFHFIVKKTDNTYGRKSLRVPFYALPPFENLLELNLERHRKDRAQAREVFRRISKNLSLEED